VIVTCEQCSTQFQLDDSKVPADGIRVRCSRCRNTFLVVPPGQPEGDLAGDLARDALGRSQSDDLESDWQFNEDIRTPAPETAAADERVAVEAAVDDLLGADFARAPAATGHLEMGGDLPGSEPAAEPTLAGRESMFDLRSTDDLDFGADPLESFETAEAPAPSEPLEAAVATEAVAKPPDGPLAEPAADLHADDLEIAADPPPTGDSPAAPAAAEPDLGIASEPAEAEPREAAPAARTPAADSDAERDESTRGADSIAAPTLDAPVQAGSDLGAPAEDVESPPASQWIARIRAGVAWALVSALCAYAGFAGLAPATTGVTAQSAPGPIAGLEVDAVRGRWIENAQAGPVYVVTGDLRSADPSGTSGSWLRVRLLDAAGRPIVAESGAAGPPLPAEQLREGNLRDLREIQEAAARRQAHTPLRPGERRPFLAILGDLPPAAEAYEFTRGE
jgi:predicted Zn finger-like uncharacterized protein